ncbi:MAG: DUF2971 domain-containing protein [Dehalococcoidales bacterium]|nr:DUF2971 domain-containing protein [Dehalococcoidales bacterium]
MILYKFKSLENFDQIVDLFLTRRLYCSTPRQINDPLEGVLGIDINMSLAGLPSDDKWKRSYEFWMEHDEKINSHRICSFSKSPKSILMWSYYGAGHSGICLELNLEEYKNNIHEVKYITDIDQCDRSSVIGLLTHKLHAWSHEEEWRWISDENSKEKYLRADIKTVLIGTGMDMKYFRPVFEMCALMNLQIDIASFNTSGEFHRLPLRKGVRWDEVTKKV